MRLVWIATDGREWHLSWRRRRLKQMAVCGATWWPWDFPIFARIGQRPPPGWRCAACLDAVALSLGLSREPAAAMFEVPERGASPMMVRKEVT